MIFADTSALYALVHRRDRGHRAAKRVIEGAAETFVFSEMIEAEVLTLVRRRTDHGTATALGDALRHSALFRLVEGSPEDRDRAWEIFRGHPDKDWSFVDCHSFAVMDRLGIQTAFAFDDDFRQRGFETIPPV